MARSGQYIDTSMYYLCTYAVGMYVQLAQLESTHT